MSKYIMAIDQGTTSSRALIFDADYGVVGSAQQEFRQIYPNSGWVEHDPEEIWKSVVATCRGAIADAGITASDIAGIGITNQRETTVVWDRATGTPIHNAIVWQDRRTADVTAALKADGLEETVSAKSGLLLDPYFSGSKVAWILDNVDGARKRAEAGELAFGTIDTFLIWRLTGGKRHVTDATNASRTLLYDINKGDWSTTLMEILRVPRQILPDVLDSAADFGETETDILGSSVPILGVAGDSRRRPSAKPAFSRACSRRPTAPDALPC